jgi:hypothetical protein
MLKCLEIEYLLNEIDVESKLTIEAPCCLIYFRPARCAIVQLSTSMARSHHHETPLSDWLHRKATPVLLLVKYTSKDLFDIGR